MPTHKSAEKRIRISEKRRLRNKSVRSEVKTSITRAEKLIFSGELEAAREAVAVAVASLDKAAEKGILHHNNTARRKSRLVRKLNQAQSEVQNKTEPEKTEPEKTEPEEAE